MAGRHQLEAYLTHLEKYSQVGMVIYSADLRILFANDLAAQFLGKSTTQLAEMTADDASLLFVQEDETSLPLADHPVQKVRATLQPVLSQMVGIKRPATADRLWLLASAFPEVAMNGDLHQVILTFVDVSQYKRIELEMKDRAREVENECLVAKRQLDEIEKAFFSAISNSPNAVSIEVEGRFVFLNRAAGALFGATDEKQLLGMPTLERIHSSERAAIAECIRLQKESSVLDVVFRKQVRVIRLDGSEVDTDSLAMLVNYCGQRAVLVFSHDITAQKRAEEEVQANASTLAAALASMSDAISISDVNGNFIHFNDAFAKFYKFTCRQECAKALAEAPDFLEVFHASGEPVSSDQWAVARALRGEVVTNSECTLRHKKSGETWIGSFSFSPIRHLDGTIVGSVVVARDITEHKQAEEALRASEERFSRMFHANPACQIITTIPSGRIIDFNEAFCRISGFSPEELIGHSTLELDMWASLADRDAILQKFRREGRVRSVEVSLKTRSGELRTMLMSMEPIELSPGEIHVISSTLDITERKQAEETRQKLQEQLLQSQKMESIGRLAGGVAHDFNNILMVQRGYCDLMRAQLCSDDPLLEALDQIDTSTERGVALTRQLLAFSRKQPLEARVLDVNKLVSHLGNMLRRLMGEDIELEIIPAAIPAMVKADPGQIEQVLVNLAVNARDAMSDGGKLTIEVLHTELDTFATGYSLDVVCGRYVMIAVSDTGCGMDRETKRRIFEPFFTTKEVGKGTGLGLSTVYGVVQQSGGNISVCSEPGQGTTFQVLLPAVKNTVVESIALESRIERGNGELVLVVEDEPALRQLAKMLIEGIGYQVLLAANADAALEMIEDQLVTPDLLITDVVMPGISGRVLVERVHKVLPRLEVIYMSGYMDDAMTRHGIPESRVNFLQKPFTMVNLAAKIKSIFEAN